MANQWFRMYAEFANDPKVQMLSETDQRRYIMLLCIRCNGDVALQDTEVAFQLRISNAEWEETKSVLIGKSLIDECNKPSSWDKRQFSSDSSATRVAKHRALKKETGNVTVTSQIQNRTDTDTEHKDKKQRATRFDAQAHLVSIGISEQLSSDWLQLRKAKKAPATIAAINGVACEAEKARISLSDALSICCQRGWAGFNSTWDWGQGKPSASTSQRIPAAENFATKNYGEARPL